MDGPEPGGRTNLPLINCSRCCWLFPPHAKASEADRGDSIFFIDGSSPAHETAARVADAFAGCDGQLWVLQRYVARPLLLNSRKFHLRVMILAVGDLSVFVHDNAVALFASDDYAPNDLSDKCGQGPSTSARLSPAVCH